ncbi:MAG: hypothetical protein HC905_22305, partial [Bacteroidales bacterium]|nr:hypothetical protein [Bacteroidales bacterium]
YGALAWELFGKGLDNTLLEFAGFAGALMHTLNHSLFKSLLFYAAGTIYQATHIINIEKLGGLMKKMPQTSLLFLLASAAICGLPPFNGFVSEFLIYTGLFNAVHSNQLSQLVLIILSIFGLVIIGGLAIFCFTKAFGIAFLGTARSEYPGDLKEPGSGVLFPKYLIAIFIVVIGILPQVFIGAVIKPVSLFTGDTEVFQTSLFMVSTMQKVGFASWTFILLVFSVYYIKRSVSRGTVAKYSETWGCGYKTLSPKLQYTSSSFSRSYRNLIKPLLRISKHEGKIESLIPGVIKIESHVLDKIEYALIDKPLRNLKGLIGQFRFLQNGSVQFYILYGVVFIFIAITIPILINATSYLFELFKQL